MPTAEATLVRPSDSDELYVIEGGHRRLVASHPLPGMFRTMGRDPGEVETLPPNELEEIPVDEAFAPGTEIAPSDMLYIDLDSFLGAGHYMTTHGALYGNGHIDAQTRTRTVTWFGGFHGAVYLVFVDSNGIPKGQSQRHVFGVDGTWIGQSDRTDYWSEDIDPAVAAVAVKLAVFHSWAPNDLKNQIERAVAIAQPILDLIKQVKSTIGDGKTT
jgi:hypothetical protein